MSSYVIYGSRFGNTQKIAEAMADVLRQRGDVRLVPAEEAGAVVPHPGDLLIVGCPTEGHTMTPVVRRWLDAMGANGLWGVTAAAFDTRVDWPRWLSAVAVRLRRRRDRSAAAAARRPPGPPRGQLPRDQAEPGAAAGRAGTREGVGGRAGRGRGSGPRGRREVTRWHPTPAS
jgi:Flavodoxin